MVPVAEGRARDPETATGHQPAGGHRGHRRFRHWGIHRGRGGRVPLSAWRNGSKAGRIGAPAARWKHCSKSRPKGGAVNRDGRFVEVPVAEVKAGEIVAVKSGHEHPARWRSRLRANPPSIRRRSLANPFRGQKAGRHRFRRHDQRRRLAGNPGHEGSRRYHAGAKIIRLVKEAQEQKAPTQRFVDVFRALLHAGVTLVALLCF
jgi:hypothetical protein